MRAEDTAHILHPIRCPDSFSFACATYRQVFVTSTEAALTSASTRLMGRLRLRLTCGGDKNRARVPRPSGKLGGIRDGRARARRAFQERQMTGIVLRRRNSSPLRQLGRPLRCQFVLSLSPVGTRQASGTVGDKIGVTDWKASAPRTAFDPSI